MIESPQSFVVREECEKAAWQHGFRRNLGTDAGWAAFGSTTAHGTIRLAAAGPQGPWFLALDHAGLIEELRLSPADMPGPGIARYIFDSLGALYAAMPRVYQLAASLPDAPLGEFQAQVKDLPMTTEADRLVVQRIGQDIFRAGLLDYWQARCPLTGITDGPLLRASHIIPWKDFRERRAEFGERRPNDRVPPCAPLQQISIASYGPRPGCIRLVERKAALSAAWRRSARRSGPPRASRSRWRSARSPRGKCCTGPTCCCSTGRIAFSR